MLVNWITIPNNLKNLIIPKNLILTPLSEVPPHGTAVVAHVRKSTNEKDKQQQSIQTQIDWLSQIVNQNPDYYLVDVIIETESAKDRGRLWFSRTMSWIENKGIKVILAMYIDRLSRNPYDNWWIQGLMQARMIEKIVTSTRVFTYQESGIIFAIESWFANEYILKLKEAVKAWLNTKIKSWDYWSQAPLWYFNDKNTKTVVVDWFRSYYIPIIFKLRLEWYTFKAITEEVYKLWLRSRKNQKVSQRSIENILHNPFYYWFMVYRWDLFNKWEVIKGNHTPLIDYDTFQKVQAINRGVIYQSNQNLTPLKGKVFFIDENWNKTMMSPTLVKKKYTFFQIKIDWKQLWFNQKYILDYFNEAHLLYKIPEAHKQEVKDVIKSSYFSDLENKTKQVAILKSHRSKKINEKNNLILMRSNWEITWEEFVELKNKITFEIENYDKEIEKIEALNSQNLDQFNNMFELLFSCLDKWHSYSDTQKLIIINEISFELSFDKQKKLYIEEKPLYTTFKMLNFYEWSGGRGLNSHTQGLKP